MSNMYRPTGFAILPPVVKNLLIINGLLFLGMLMIRQVYHTDLNDVLGLRYFSAEKFRPFQLLTYMFMHANFMHLFFNMFALWMFGSAIENLWGPKRFLIFYLITGIGAALVHYLVVSFEILPTVDKIDAFIADPSNEKFLNFINYGSFKVVSEEIQTSFQAFAPKYNQLLSSNPAEALHQALLFMNDYRIEFLNTPNVIGASGSVFGLLLAFGMMFPNSIVYIYFAIPLKAKWFVILYGAIELFAGVSNNGSDVAHFAHLGGMIFGLLLILYWRYQENQKRKRFYE